MNLYFTLRTWLEFIIPAAIIAIIFILFLIKVITNYQKEKLLESFGFNKYIDQPISGYNSSTTYEWTRKSDHKTIKEWKLHQMSFKEIKKLK